MSKARSAPEFRPGMGQNVVSRRYQHQDPSGKVSDLFQQYKKQTSGAGKQRWADKTQQGLEEESTMKLSRNNLKQLVKEELAGLLEADWLPGDDFMKTGKLSVRPAAPALKYWTQRGEATSIAPDAPDSKAKVSSLSAQGKTPSGERAVGSVTLDQAKAYDKAHRLPGDRSSATTKPSGLRHAIDSNIHMYQKSQHGKKGGKSYSTDDDAYSSEHWSKGNQPDTFTPIGGLSPEQAKKYSRDLTGYDPKTGRATIVDRWAMGADTMVGHGYQQQVRGDSSAQKMAKDYDKLKKGAGLRGREELGGAKQMQDKGYRGAYQSFRYGTTPGVRRKSARQKPRLEVPGLDKMNKAAQRKKDEKGIGRAFGWDRTVDDAQSSLEKMKESTMKLTRNDLKQLVQEEVGVLLEQPAGAGVDTSGVQQSHQVTQVLRIIDGMREDEINALMAAMENGRPSPSPSRVILHT